MSSLNEVGRRSDGDLCKAYQPITFSTIIGQDSIVASLRSIATNKNTSRCFLFHGERGCGKTTMARVVAMAVNCDNISSTGEPCGSCPSCTSIIDGSSQDVKEINAASHNGVNDIRDLESDMQTKSLFSANKVYILDEAHMLTREAQNALLKNAENIPEGVFLILCSTEPGKLIKTLRDRCESYRFTWVDDEVLLPYVTHVAAMEGFFPDDRIISAIVSSSDGRPRNALRLLQKVINVANADPSTFDGKDLDLYALFDEYSEEEITAIDLCKKLMSSYEYTWKEIISVYKKIPSSPETVSFIMAGWFRKCLERAKSQKQADKHAKALEFFMDVPLAIKPENALLLSVYKTYKLFHGKVA